MAAVRDGDDEYLDCSQKVTSNIFSINQNGALLYLDFKR